MSSLSPSTRRLLILGLALSLLGLCLHSWQLRFFTDDAFIAFRYARNLGAGFGAVFNPGFEAVEGFSSPAWVLLLAGLSWLGCDLPTASLWLSGLGTLGLWGMLARLSWLALPQGASRLWVLLPLTLLALTRSVAMWSSGGLETRCFEALVLLAVLRLWREAESLPVLRGRLPLGGLVLGLVAWTRPEGALLAASLPALLWCLGPSEPARRRWILRTLGASFALVAALFLTRFLVFDAWLPNTYYAKLDGRSWWSMGWAYLAMFFLEYGVVFWLPLMLLGARALGRSSNLLQLILGVCVPLLVYCVAIGGDHFEYRPLDLFFPYAYLLLTLGVVRVWREGSSRIALAGLLFFSLAGVWCLPRLTRTNYPSSYAPGFPGLVDSEQARAFPRSSEHALLGLPGLSQLGRWHGSLLRYTSEHFVGLRREEHGLFFELMSEKAERLQRLIRAGVLPADLHIALDCVGVMPYVTDLCVLDRLGLTDFETARTPFARADASAHGKYAKPEYAAARGVDLWPLQPRGLLWEEGPAFRELLASSRAAGLDFVLAELEPGLFLLAWLPQGLEAAQARLPRLKLKSILQSQ